MLAPYSRLVFVIIVFDHTIFVGSQRLGYVREAHELLEKYGYSNDNPNLKGSNPFGSEGGTSEDWIKTFQVINRPRPNIQITGRFNDETHAYLRADRCGNMDILSPDDVPESLTTRRGTTSEQSELIFKSWSSAGKPWSTNKLKYFVKYPILTEDGLTTETIRFTFRAAFNIWQEAANLQFTEVDNPEEAHIKISFESGDHGDGNQFNGKGRDIAHAFYPGDGRIHLDKDEQWTAYGFVDFHEKDLIQVATHLIGHALGLAHSKVPQNVMNPYYTYQYRFGLGQGDLEGIRALYGDRVSSSTRHYMGTCIFIIGLTMALLIS